MRELLAIGKDNGSDNTVAAAPIWPLNGNPTLHDQIRGVALGQVEAWLSFPRSVQTPGSDANVVAVERHSIDHMFDCACPWIRQKRTLSRCGQGYQSNGGGSCAEHWIKEFLQEIDNRHRYGSRGVKGADICVTMEMPLEINIDRTAILPIRRRDEDAMPDKGDPTDHIVRPRF